jgi:hypothetical protein
MKKLYAIIILLVIPTFSFSQVLSDCASNQSILFNAYKKDINFLAVERLFQIHHPDTAKIIVPSIHTDSIQKAILGVFNLGTQLEADSVFSHHCIHEHYASANTIYVAVDTSFAWTQAWQNLQINTSNVALNNFINAYGFSVLYFNLNSGVLQTNQSLNLKAFRDSLETFAGVGYTWDDNAAGDGNRIKYNIVNGNQQLNFTLGWGDCPAGCTSFKTWKYTVAPNCQVTAQLPTISNGFGEPEPTPTGCNLVPNSIANINQKEATIIYPNPAQNYIEIKNANQFKTYSLQSIDGIFVRGEKEIKAKIEIQNIPSGIYILTLTDKNKQPYFYRVVKETK